MIPSTIKTTQLVCLYYINRPNKNESRTDLTNDDQRAYEFAPTYGDGSTDYHRHMISVVVFSTQIQFKACWRITQLQRWLALMNI